MIARPLGTCLTCLNCEFDPGQGKSSWRDDILILSGKPEEWLIEEPDEDDGLWLVTTVLNDLKYLGFSGLETLKNLKSYNFWCCDCYLFKLKFVNLFEFIGVAIIL